MGCRRRWRVRRHGRIADMLPESVQRPRWSVVGRRRSSGGVGFIVLQPNQTRRSVQRVLWEMGKRIGEEGGV
jgi:hypothetical protein